MEKINVLCPAKINLFLNIIGKNDDMHDMHMINQTVDLYDTLEISVNGTIFDHFECNNSQIDTNDNSVLKALKIMRYLYDIRLGFDIKLTKRIPLESGLGGESTDAAGLILGINDLFKLNLDMETLIKIGLMIGADVPFCLVGGTALVSEIGNVVKPIPRLIDNYVIIKPDFGLKTKDMFQKFDQSFPIYKVFDELCIGWNDFEIVAPLEIQTYKERLINNGAFTANMSGSGSAVVGYFHDTKSQLRTYRLLRRFFEIYPVMACDGIEILNKKSLC